MPRIRTVKPEFWEDRRLATDLDRDQRLFYVGMWNHADDDGRLRGEPRRLLGSVFPYEDDLDETFVVGVLARLVETGRAVCYGDHGERYVELVKFREHQKINRPTASSIPPPPKDLQDPHGWLSELSVSPHAPYQWINGGGTDGEVSTPPVVPPEKRQVDEIEITDSELVETANRTLGMGALKAWKSSEPNQTTNRELVNHWLHSEGRKREDVLAAILGAADLRDNGGSWLERGKPYDLRVLYKAGAIRDQGDGKARTSLWTLAVERYRAPPEQRKRRKQTEPARVDAQAILEQAKGAA